MFALIDCNSFFASCERVFRPELQNQPVAVLSNNDGCIIARTKEVKDLNIAMGVPFFKVKEVCRQKKVAIFSSNFSLYSNLSKRVMSIVRQENRNVFEYSIDEIFVEFKSEDFKNDIAKINTWGSQLREKILRDTGIPVSIGIAATKTLAKLTNSYVKKHDNTFGVKTILGAAESQDLLKWASVDKIWGIGRKQAQKCLLFNIKNAFDYTQKDSKFIDKIFTKNGLQTWLELKGESCIDLHSKSVHRKSVSATRSFAKPVVTYQGLESAITNFITRAAEKLKQENLVTNNLFIFARTSPFMNVPQRKILVGTNLEQATSDTRYLLQQAVKLLKESYESGTSFKKAGVFFTDLESKNERQLSLFSSYKEEPLLVKTIDRINRYYGPDSIYWGSLGVKAKAIWKMNREFKSPNYLNNWRELPLFY